MGYVVVGTSLFVYDDASNAGGHAAGTPHSYAEIFTLFNVGPNFYVSGLFDALGATVFPGVAMVSNVNIVIGGQTTDGQNTTTFIDTGKHVFFKAGFGLSFRNTGSTFTTTTLGTRLGTGDDSVGRNGCVIYQTGAINWRQNVNLWGCHVHMGGAVLNAFVIDGTNVINIGGCVFDGQKYALGTQDVDGLNIYNSIFGSLATDQPLTAIRLGDAHDVMIACAAPSDFISVNSALRTLTSVRLIGTPSRSDIRITAGAPNWKVKEMSWSGTVGIPKVMLTIAPPGIAAGSGVSEYRFFQTHVGDQSGTPLSDIPVRLYSDIDGLWVDAKTSFDGDIAFNAIGLGTNFAFVRDHYSTNDGAANQKQREHIFTIVVNGTLGSFVPNPNFATKIITFTWSGLYQRKETAVSTPVGDFNDIFMPIQLQPGTPNEDSAVTWDECQLTP